MLKFLFALVVFCVFAPCSSVAQESALEEEIKEVWTGDLFTSSYRAGICFSPRGVLRGVLHLYLKNGKMDVYHITGRVQDKKIEARHSSGHEFQGELVAPDKVEGRITLKNGLRITLVGKRGHNASLAPEDCAPPRLP